MKRLNLPTYLFKIKSEGERKKIFDDFRKKWVFLTPEEWVRQNFLKFLVSEKHYLSGRISVEKAISVHGISYRYDAVIYSSVAVPLIAIEFKAPEVKITQSVFDQILSYNIQLQVPFLIVSNGMEHYCIQNSGTSWKYLDDIPDYLSIPEL